MDRPRLPSGSGQPIPSGTGTSTYDVIPTSGGSEIYLPKNYELPPDTEYVGEKITDPVTLVEIFDTCVDMYKTHKITPQNAFSLKLIECLGEVLQLDGFDKNNMQNVGKTLEVGTKIFSCRVEHTDHRVKSLAEDLADKTKKKRGNIIEDVRDEGENVDGSVNGGHGSDREGNLNDTSYTIGPEEENDFEQLEDGVIIPSLTFWNPKNPNKNILEDKDFDMDETSGDDNGEHRRLKLKDSFDGFSQFNKKFDYASFIFGKVAIDEKRRGEPSTKLNEIRFINPVIVNISAMGHMNTIGFLRFGKNKFDSDCFDIWGNPINAVGINKNDNIRAKMLEKRRQLRERLSIRRDDLMSQHSQNQESVHGSERMDVDPPVYLPEGMDRDYDDGAADMIEDNENFDPIDENGQLKEVNINDITTLNDVDRVYEASTKFKADHPSNYGWMGPKFVRSRRPRNKTLLKKKKPQPKAVKFLELDWDSSENRFLNAKADVDTELDDEVIKQWANRETLIPSMGECDDDSEVEDDHFNDAFEGAIFQKSDDKLPRMMNLFIDHRRRLYDGVLNRIPAMANESNIFDGEGFEHDDEGVSFHNGNYAPAPFNDLEGFRALEEDVTALGANENFMCEEDLDIMRRHKIIPSGFGSPVEEYRFSEIDSLKHARRPKPINMSKVKDCIGVILREQLKLDDKGRPTLEEETTTDMMRLMTEIISNADDNTLRYLTLAITLVATLHVTVDMRLFMDSGILGSIENPKIICHGKNWVHADHIPGMTCQTREIESEEMDEASAPKRRRIVVRPSLRRMADEALNALTDSSEEVDDEQDKENCMELSS